MVPPRRPPPSVPLRVTSLNPVRDAKSIGHDVGVSRAVLDAKFTALQQRYRKLVADAVIAEGDEDRRLRLDSLLIHVGLACDAIADDLTALEHMSDTEAAQRRDQLVREAGTELIALAELSSGRALPATAANWREALAQLRAFADGLIRSDARSASLLADLDVVLERIDHAERLASNALGSYLGYVTA
jgi:hypothetical protein